MREAKFGFIQPTLMSQTKPELKMKFRILRIFSDQRSQLSHRWEGGSSILVKPAERIRRDAGKRIDGVVQLGDRRVELAGINQAGRATYLIMRGLALGWAYGMLHVRSYRRPIG